LVKFLVGGNSMVAGSKIRIFFGLLYFSALMACQGEAPKSLVRPSSSPLSSFNPYGASTLNSTIPTYTPIPMGTLDPSIANADAYRQQQLAQQRQQSQTAGLLTFLSCSTRSGGGGGAGGASAAGLGNLLGCATQGLMTSMGGGLSGGLSGGYGGYGSTSGLGGFNSYSTGGFNNFTTGGGFGATGYGTGGYGATGFGTGGFGATGFGTGGGFGATGRGTGGFGATTSNYPNSSFPNGGTRPYGN
jgi:hypothetical protein